MMASAGKKRILMLVENCPYPADFRVRQEATALVAAGCDVTVIAPAEKGEPRKEVVDGVRVRRYPGPRQGDGLFGYLWEYSYSMVASFIVSLGVFFRFGFDVVHAHNPPDFFVFIGIFYKLFGKKFVFDHHDLSPEMYRARFSHGGNTLIYNTLVFFEKLTFRFANRVISTNESYKKIAVERGKVPAENVTVVRNGPKMDRFRRVDPDKGVRAKSSFVIGYVGVMGVQDGLDYLVRALHHLKNDLDRNDFYAVVVGDGSARESLIELTAEMGLEDHIWFTGYVPQEDMLRYLSTADLFVDPDPKNPFSDRSTMIKMVEYLALERPIVSFDLTEHRASAGDAALYAEANDELDFARKIAELMDDEPKRREMGEIGRQRIETLLAWEYQIPNLIYTYQQLGFDIESPAYNTVATSVATDAVVS